MQIMRVRKLACPNTVLAFRFSILAVLDVGTPGINPGKRNHLTSQVWGVGGGVGGILNLQQPPAMGMVNLRFNMSVWLLSWRWWWWWWWNIYIGVQFVYICIVCVYPIRDKPVQTKPRDQRALTTAKSLWVAARCQSFILGQSKIKTKYAHRFPFSFDARCHFATSPITTNKCLWALTNWQLRNVVPNILWKLVSFARNYTNAHCHLHGRQNNMFRQFVLL